MRALSIVHQRDAGPGVFAHALREAGWHTDSWLIPEHPEPPVDPHACDAVLVFGGAMHADQEDRHPWIATEKGLLADLLAREVPLLGVCLGSQLLAEAAGAPARRAGTPEIGWFELEVAPEAAGDPVIGPLAPSFDAFEWHSYETPLPPGAIALARSEVCLQAYRIGELAWGIQFHAEVTGGDAQAWIDDFGSDEDAVALALDWDALSAQTRARMPAWNALGRGLCSRFLKAAARR